LFPQGENHGNPPSGIFKDFAPFSAGKRNGIFEKNRRKEAEKIFPHISLEGSL
jgi:hypothetical protein